MLIFIILNKDISLDENSSERKTFQVRSCRAFKKHKPTTAVHKCFQMFTYFLLKNEKNNVNV